MKVKTNGGKILAVTIAACFLWTGIASGETNTYTFDPNQSTVVRSFFTSYTYTLIGAFQLTVDANTGSFDWVDATFSDDPNLQTGDLRELFYMDELVGDVVNDTTIEFELPPGHPVLQSYDIHITVTFENDQVHLAGYRNPLMVGEPGYTLDAVANVMTIFYVDSVNGDDDNDGLSPETAFATIQKGIDSAQNGDLVIVLPGTYAGSGNRDIDFKGKAITVRGENGPNSCIVDCEAQGRGFYFHTGENADSVLEGLTIMNGSTQNMGAGIFCVGTSPSIRNCIIRNCSILGTGAGGGISCDGGGPAIITCTIIDNTALEGGGIYLLNCNAMINSCTISRNGNYYSLGGGIYSRDSSPTITDCTITENDGDNGGGGMYCKNSSPTITDCTITENYGGNGGGGMYCEYGSLSITDCNFVRNEADYGGGGGIMCTDSNVAISRCTFTENGTDADYSDGGGAIHLVRTGGAIADCSFIDNETIGGSGAGIFCDDQSSPVINNCSFVSHRDDVVTCSDDSNPIIRDCSFTENRGTPIDISGSTPTVSHCEIVDNYMMGFEIGGVCSPLIVNCRITGNDLGGVWIGGGSPTIVNCTIADNRQYAGIFCQGGHVNIHNSILWENKLLTGEPNSILLEGEATATVTHSDVQGGWPGAGNIDADPWFIDPHGGNYWVMPISQCINTGDNAAVPPTVLTDLDGNPRIVNGTVDMGAYEFQGIQILYVDAAAPQLGDGTSWATAFKYLQDALFKAVPPAEIRVAQGIYKPHLNTYSAAPPSRTDTFQLRNGVTIKGGYAGLGQPDPDVRDISLYETILSGDMNGDDEPNFANNGENSYHVVTGYQTSSMDDTTDMLDGFIVVGGNANSSSYPDNYGGGMYCNSDATVINCTFTRNSAIWGGGMYCGPSWCCATNTTLTNCTFIGNSASEEGGAMWIGDNDPTMTNCRIIGNSAGRRGGGMMFGNDNRTTMFNCLISGNLAGEDGGGIYCIFSFGWTVTNCTFSNNSADNLGGGMFKGYDTSMTLTNCIFWGNGDSGGADESAQIHVYDEGGYLLINFTCILGWTGGFGGMGNIGDDPLFVDADGTDNVDGTEDDNLRLLAGSTCINAGDNTAVPPSVLTDLDGNPRIVAGTVDMGSYEFWGPVYVDDDGPNDPGPGDPSVSDPLEDGTDAHPFDTIQEAINVAKEGYTVLVRQGSYFELGTSNCIDFLGKNITLTSADPTDWAVVDNTIVRGYVQFTPNEGPDCKFTGFRISSLEGAIYGNHTHATISHCNISGNGPCGATVIKDCDGTISNCLITDNTTFFKCGVFPVVFGCNGLIKNCTITNNESGLSVGTATIENCIIYNNTGSQLGVGDSETLNISYCNLQGGLEGITGGGIVNWGPGNIETDPCFVRLGYWIMDEMALIEGDYHLRSEGWRWNTDSNSWTYDYITSRCVDAGNPASDLGGELMSVPRDPDNIWGVNLRINMGAFGGTSQAGMPPHGWALLPDLNNDGIVNYLDFAYQAQDWQATAPEQPGDQNRDGVVNKMDLARLAEDWLKITTFFIPEPDVPTGSLRVVILPSAVIDAGAQWRVDNGTWHDSTYTKTGLCAGPHMLEYKHIIGWITPPTETVQIELSQTTTRVGTYIPVDVIPPAPVPVILTIQAISPSSIMMTATEAFDESGVQYYFEATTVGGHDSGWLDEPNYTDVNLVPDTTYCYRVKARDKSVNYNETIWSPQVCTATPPPPDTLPPLPDPIQWDPVVDANGYDGRPLEVFLAPFGFNDYGATMRAIDADDVAPPGMLPNEVEYYFQCQDDSGFDSGWRTVAAYPNELERRTYTVKIGPSGLAYRFRVKARDASDNLNETGWSDWYPAVYRDPP